MSSTAISTFERLKDRYRLSGQLLAATGLRVGGGDRSQHAATQSPIIRDALGRPFIPGSSLKGVLRSGLESLLRGLDHERLKACDPFEDRCTEALEEKAKKTSRAPELDEVVEKLCTACALFGSPLLAGRVFVRDLALEENGTVTTEIRDGVGINRDLRTAQAKVKYDLEVVPVGSRFSLEMIVENPNLGQLGLVLEALAMLDRGELLVGGLTSRGLGRVRVEGLKLEHTNARRLFTGQGWQEQNLEETRSKAQDVLRELLAEGGN
ncbi:MAG: CRISPR-associated RAMP protein [Thermoanaerobaculia bacterium]|nr:CRISPR-associated RAMP protein [Thermoanaerobaculia bacterium]